MIKSTGLATAASEQGGLHKITFTLSNCASSGLHCSKVVGSRVRSQMESREIIARHTACTYAGRNVQQSSSLQHSALTSHTL